MFRNTSRITSYTGPLVALLNPADDSHTRCVGVLRSIHEPLATSLPVLTEAFTIDRNDFAIYRIKRGHRHYGFELLD